MNVYYYAYLGTYSSHGPPSVTLHGPFSSHEDCVKEANKDRLEEIEEDYADDDFVEALRAGKATIEELHDEYSGGDNYYGLTIVEHDLQPTKELVLELVDKLLGKGSVHEQLVFLEELRGKIEEARSS